MNRYLLVFIIIFLLYFPCYISDDLLAKLTDEDGPYESTGAILFLFAAIAFAILAANPKLYLGKKGEEKYPERWYFLFFTLLFIFSFGEEISWGQRIFDFSTPEVIKGANMQQEFNLHNLEIFHGLGRDGKKKTGLMAMFTMHRIFYMTFLTYLFILPVLYLKSSWVKTLIKKIRIPVPKLVLGVLFGFNLMYGNILRAINPSLENHGVVEIKETAIALILFALPLSWINLKKWKQKKSNVNH